VPEFRTDLVELVGEIEQLEDLAAGELEDLDTSCLPSFRLRDA